MSALQVSWRHAEPLVPSLQIASKMDPADKSTIESAVDDAISWLDTNQLAEVRMRIGAGPCQHMHNL